MFLFSAIHPSLSSMPTFFLTVKGQGKRKMLMEAVTLSSYYRLGFSYTPYSHLPVHVGSFTQTPLLYWFYVTVKEPWHKRQMTSVWKFFCFISHQAPCSVAGAPFLLSKMLMCQGRTHVQEKKWQRCHKHTQKGVFLSNGGPDSPRQS